MKRKNHGHVAKFVAGEGYGFIETADGRKVYFHRNSVLDDAFEHLTSKTALYASMGYERFANRKDKVSRHRIAPATLSASPAKCRRWWRRSTRQRRSAPLQNNALPRSLRGRRRCAAPNQAACRLMHQVARFAQGCLPNIGPLVAIKGSGCGDAQAR